MFNRILLSNNHEFEQVVNVELHDVCLNWARETALNKLSNTADTWQNRHPNAKVMDLLYGDYAKNLVKAYITTNIDNITIIEYDLIRHDDFVNSDLYDLKIGNDEIEVKSSLEKNSRNLETINRDRNIIINQHISHITRSRYIFQVFFVPRNLGNFISMENINTSLNGTFNQNLFNQHLEEFNLSNIDIYICGWIDNSQQISNGSFSVSNYNTGASRRNYARMPIRQSNNPRDFLELLING
ncbi:MAG: hypothetical protein ABII85_01460 [Bacillota bacterium]